MKKLMTIAVMRKVVLSDVEKLMIGSVDNNYYADLEKEWRQEFNFVEKNHQKSTATCLSLVADLMNHEPSSSKDTSASQEPKTKLLLPLSQETRGKIKTSTLKSMLMNLLCVKTESKIQMTWPWFLRTTMWKR